MSEKVGVGIGVIVFNENGEFLMGKRKNAHGSGSWSVQGGHIEFGETLENCAKREVFEETGLNIKNVKIISFDEHIFEKEKKHYISFFALSQIESGTPEVKEPHKCEGWHWFSDWDNLPQPTFVNYHAAVSKEQILDYLKENK